MIDLPWLPSMAALALAARAEKAQDDHQGVCPAQGMCGPKKCQQPPAQRAGDTFKCSVAKKSFDKMTGENLP